MKFELSYSDILNKLFLHNNVLMIKHNNKNLIVDTVNILIQERDPSSINELYKILTSLNYILPLINNTLNSKNLNFLTLYKTNNTVIGKTFITVEENYKYNNIVISQHDFINYCTNFNKIYNTV